MKKQFTYYLHDNASSYERAADIEDQMGMHFTDDQIELMGRPFYEVGLYCEIDTDTMEVTILGVKP